jgi:3-dehydroquinate dehydratase/shikimate dehydrogenase
MRELREARDAVADADLVELRLDGVRDLDVAGALQGRRRPVIVTCRPVWEGGRFDGSEEERRRILREALGLGADYVDVEWRTGDAGLVRARGGRGVVVSLHEFGDAPPDLEERVVDAASSGAEAIKVAVRAERLTDLIRLAAIGRRLGGRAVLVGMGRAGLPSRVLAARLGSRWTYAGPLGEVGQIPAERLLGLFRFRRVTDATRVYGIVGRPLEHSVSPALHNAGFEQAGIDAVYVPFEAADTDDFLAFAAAFGVEGASVTAPFKVDFLARSTDVDPLARRIGAVNTLRLDDGGWQATNTDAPGFSEPLAARIDVRGLRASVLGAGGAARAVAAALAEAGARVTIVARRLEAARGLAAAIGGEAAAWPVAPGSWDVLVNATPIGTRPRHDESPVPPDALTGRLVYDLVYNPPRTRLLDEAARAGCATVSGLEMLVRQAELQFEWWTGRRPEPGLFRRAAEAALCG